jgi:hypothetical protein
LHVRGSMSSANGRYAIGRSISESGVSRMVREVTNRVRSRRIYDLRSGERPTAQCPMFIHLTVLVHLGIVCKCRQDLGSNTVRHQQAGLWCQNCRWKSTYCRCTTARHTVQEGRRDKQIRELQHAKALPSQCCGCPQQGHSTV